MTSAYGKVSVGNVRIIPQSFLKFILVEFNKLITVWISEDNYKQTPLNMKPYFQLRHVNLCECLNRSNSRTSSDNR